MRMRMALAAIGASALLGLAAVATPAAAATAGGGAGSVVHQSAKPVPVRPPSSPGIALGSHIPAKPRGLHAVRPDTPAVWTVTLTASQTFLWPTQFSTLTATANGDVGPTPFFIRIYDLTTASYVATCGTGTTCSLGVTSPTASVQTYVAVISDFSSAYPPGNIQATAQTIFVDWQFISVSLTASPTTVPVGSATTLTATASTDVGPTPFYIEIFDATTGAFITVCGFGSSCSTGVTQNTATTDDYVAYVAGFGEALPPPEIQSTSSNTYVTWNSGGWQVSLTGPDETFSAGTYTATTNMNVGPTPFFIEIFSETTGALLQTCGAGTSCSVSYTPSRNGETLVAFVSGFSSSVPPASAQASSNTLFTFFQIIP